MCVLGQVVELTCLHLQPIVVVDDVVPGLEAVVVKVLHLCCNESTCYNATGRRCEPGLVYAEAVIMHKRRPGSSCARVDASHVVKEYTYIFSPRSVAGSNHAVRVARS